MKTIKEYWFTILVLVALTIPNIIAICRAYPRDLGIDYLGWIVGILALLTTILIGWQIYTMFDLKQIKDELKKKELDIFTRSKFNLIEFETAMHMMYKNKNDKTEEDIFLMFMHLTTAIIHYSDIGRFKDCSELTGVLLSHDKLLLQTPLRKSYHKALIDNLLRVHNPSGIQQYDALLGLFFAAPHYEEPKQGCED